MGVARDWIGQNSIKILISPKIIEEMKKDIEHIREIIIAMNSLTIHKKTEHVLLSYIEFQKSKSS